MIAQDYVSYNENRIYIDQRPLVDLQSYDSGYNKYKQKGSLIVKNFIDFYSTYADYRDEDLISHWRFLDWRDCEGEIVTTRESLFVDNIEMAVLNNENTDNVMFLLNI